jgi:CheY-like chemotaxis protein
MIIFYVDDDADDREIFGLALNEINPNYEVHYAQDGQDAIVKLLQLPKPPAFIFLDINMPVMTGIECLAKLKSDSNLKNTPVIIYSTTADEKEAHSYFRLGAQDVVTKSNSLSKVKESIATVLTKEYSMIF